MVVGIGAPGIEVISAPWQTEEVLNNSHFFSHAALFSFCGANEFTQDIVELWARSTSEPVKLRCFRCADMFIEGLPGFSQRYQADWSRLLWFIPIDKWENLKNMVESTATMDSRRNLFWRWYSVTITLPAAPLLGLSGDAILPVTVFCADGNEACYELAPPQALGWRYRFMRCPPRLSTKVLARSFLGPITAGQQILDRS